LETDFVGFFTSCGIKWDGEKLVQEFASDTDGLAARSVTGD